MLRRRTVVFSNALLVVDILVSMAAFLGTFFFRQFLARMTMHSEQLSPWMRSIELPLVTETYPYEMLLLSMPLLFGMALYLCGTTDFRTTFTQLAFRYARAVALGLGLLLMFSFLFRLQPAVARSFIVMFGVVSIPMLLIARAAVMELAAFIRQRRVDGHRVVIVGCTKDAVHMASALRSQAAWNLRLLGHVCVPNEECDHNAEPRLGDVEHLAELLDSMPVDEVVFGTNAMAHGSEPLANALAACDERGVDVLLPLPPSLPLRAKVEIANVDGYDAPLLGLRRTPTGEMRLAMKRMMDIAGSSFGLLVAAPVMLFIAAVIKLTSKGPVFFKQTRAGRNGRKFVMYKFRSMCVDAEAKKAQLMHLNEMSGPVFKIAKDPRVTKIGAFIRKTSLDELPQMFNIFLGDMSLVGPRPPLPSEVDQYKPWQRRRLSVRPGLTGLWQVSGRNNVDFEEWMALDLRYIDNWSLMLDAKIILRTLPAVVFKTGAS